MKHKILKFKAYVQNQFKMSIEHVRSDNGGEFVNHFLLHLFLSSGVIHQTSCPHTPEQNGIVERKHRHLIETTIALLLQAQLPTVFWLEALSTAVYLANRLPHSALNFQVPYVLLHKVHPNYHQLKSFGCLCYPWLRPYSSHKLVPRSTSCVFLGYCDTTKGYKCYDPLTKKVYVSRHVQFIETEFPYKQIISHQSPSADTLSPHQFTIPLTSYSDIVVSIPIPESVSPSPSPPFPPHISTPSSPTYQSPMSTSSSVPVSPSIPTGQIPIGSFTIDIPCLPSSSLVSHPMVTRS